MHFKHALKSAILVFVAGATLSAPAIATAAEELPVREVALFRSGVGYFLRQGAVQDDATIELSFKADEINDILKSMVLLDLDGGQIDSVGYASNEPLERRLAGFGLDLSGMPSVAELLFQLRGAPVSLQLVDRAVEGTVFGVEERQVPVEDGVPSLERFVTVVGAEGMQTVPISKISRFTILDQKLQAELEKALVALAESRDPDKKRVTIRLSGEGEREVMAGYVAEMPVWKMSYRLMLDDTGAARLQGWAIVENTTDSDWEDVDLSLVSGQPVSFVMDLYEPLFIQRPEVAVDVVALADAPVYEGEEMMRGVMAKAAAPRQAGRGGGGGGNIFGGAGGASRDRYAEDAAAGQSIQLGAALAGVAAAATGSVEGEQFFFQLNRPITLARRQSAMVPVLNEKLPIDRVSIFNASHLPNHPMRGVRLENASGMALMPGPVTVFDGNLYGGDARLPRVAEGGEQVLSFAIDLDVDVKVDYKSTRSGRTLKIVKGVLTEIEKVRQRTIYTANNKDVLSREVVIEHPKDGNWKLVSPQEPDASTPNYYRFTVPLDEKTSDELEIVQEREVWSRTMLGNIGVPQLEALIIDGDVGPKVRKALELIVIRQQEITGLERQIDDVRSQLSEIEQDQRRIRENIGKVDRDSELYSRYMKKLNDQETQIESLQERGKQLSDALATQRALLVEHLNNLDIEG
jgi:hypothetical protein